MQMGFAIRAGLVALFLCLFNAESSSAADVVPDAQAAPGFKEGDVITFEKIDSIKQYVPKEYWDNRQFFFFEGMQLQIGPTMRDYTAAPEYLEVTDRYKGQPKIGPDGSLENFTGGMAFPVEDVDCKGDPDAGPKVIWDFFTGWHGGGANVHFYYTYFDRGEQLPLFYQGHARVHILTRRIEKQFHQEGRIKKGYLPGDLFKKETRAAGRSIDVHEPFDARGIKVLIYNYKNAGVPLKDIQNNDMWVYVPSLRRVRRISAAIQTEGIQGTDMFLEDVNGFNGIVQKFEWKCLGEMKLLTPINSQILAYPYKKDHNFGPYGLSLANDTWELRDAIVVRSTPRDPEHPYLYKDLYLDKQTMKSIYAIAYDKKGELWKVIQHAARWSEDQPDYFVGWEGIPKPRVILHVGDTIANVQTGTGNRIEYWDSHGTPPLKKDGSIDVNKIRRDIDVGRLTQGR